MDPFWTPILPVGQDKWSQKGVKNGPKTGPKMAQKRAILVVKNGPPFGTPSEQVLTRNDPFVLLSRRVVAKRGPKVVQKWVKKGVKNDP